MTDFAKSVYDALVGDEELVAMLSTYSGRPAVFMTDVAPPNAKYPFIVSSDPVASAEFDTKTTTGRDITRDVRCYDASRAFDGVAGVPRSPVVVNRIAERARRVLIAAQLFGVHLVLKVVSGPVAVDDEEAYGRVVTVRAVVEDPP